MLRSADRYGRLRCQRFEEAVRGIHRGTGTVVDETGERESARVMQPMLSSSSIETFQARFELLGEILFCREK